MYQYRAIITSAYDADTVTADIDLGFGVWLRGQKLRLYGINAPEVRGEEREEGLKSRDALRAKLGLGVVECSCLVVTYRDKKGKYGRWLAKILLEDGTDVNDWLISSGLAKEADY
jgi:micrococcal nuclease